MPVRHSLNSGNRRAASGSAPCGYRTTVNRATDARPLQATRARPRAPTRCKTPAAALRACLEAMERRRPGDRSMRYSRMDIPEKNWARMGLRKTRRPPRCFSVEALCCVVLCCVVLCCVVLVVLSLERTQPSQAQPSHTLPCLATPYRAVGGLNSSDLWTLTRITGRWS
jgi:hypothetical protein